MRRASSGRAGDLPHGSRGARHPVTVMTEQMTDVLLDLGYRVTEGPEIEAEWFTLVPTGSPDFPGVAEPAARRPGRVRRLRVRDPTGSGRGAGLVLRAHTASLRMRAMLGASPPLRAVYAGRLFRPGAVDAAHGPVLNEVGGVAVELGLTAVDLRKTLDHFAASVFGRGTVTRLRPRRPARAEPTTVTDPGTGVRTVPPTPPETDPGADLEADRGTGMEADAEADAEADRETGMEMDVEVACPVCHGAPEPPRGDTGAGPCGACGGAGWARWGRCGPVHRRVLATCGVDPHRYGAFAFGLGVERTLMLRHGLRDVRDLVDGDVRPLLRMGELWAYDPPPGGSPRPGSRPRATPGTRTPPEARTPSGPPSAPGSRTPPGARSTPTSAAVPAARAVPEMETIPLTRAGLGTRGTPGNGAVGGLGRAQVLWRRIGHALADAGYVETPRLPFVCDAAWDAFDLAPGDARRDAPVLTDPIDPRERSLRTTLLPGLLAALALNLARGNPEPALFEQGTVFTSLPGTGPPPSPPLDRRPTDDQLTALEAAIPAQPRHLAVALTGESSWARAVDAARTAAHIVGAGLVTRPAVYAPWLSGRCLELLAAGTVLGHAGELRPGTARALGLPPGTSAMELDLTAMERLTGGRDG